MYVQQITGIHNHVASHRRSSVRMTCVKLG
jgi:hypothetical protein